MIPAGKAPFTGPYSVAGNGKHVGPTAEALKRAMKRAGFGFANKDLDELTQDFNTDLEGALDRWDPGGKDGYADGRWKKIRRLLCPPGTPHEGEYALDEYACRLLHDEAMKEKVPALGPVFSGGQSVLLQDLTHATSGLPVNARGESLWPAFDDAFAAGKTIVAPENMEVTKDSSSNPGDACYTLGDSELQWWFGHLVTAPAIGTWIKKGATIGKTCPNDLGGGPHVHVALNVERLWGLGIALTGKTNYTHGGPLIGDQLAAGRPLPIPPRK